MATPDTEQHENENDYLNGDALPAEAIQLAGDRSTTFEIDRTTTVSDEDAGHSSSTIHRTPSHHTPSTQLQNLPSHRIDPEKYCGWFRGYVRQDWDTVVIPHGIDELRANWVELFFDLIYVACIVHLSAEAATAIAANDSHRRLAGTSSTSSSRDHCSHEWPYAFLFTSFAEFGLLTTAWRHQVQYVTHFVFNQKIDDFIRILYMICVLCMGIFIQDDEAYERAFLISYGLLHVVMIFMFLKVLMIPRGRNHAIWFIAQSSVTIIIVIILLSTVRHQCNLVWFGVYLGLFIFDMLGIYGSYIVSKKLELKPRIAIPLNVPHIAERYGLFIMLILGESLISIMSADLGELNLEQEFVWADDGTPPSQVLVGFVILVFCLTYCIGRLYYDCQPSEEAIMEGHDNHALRISATRGRMYMYAHQMLFFGLLGLGVGIKIAAKHLLDSTRRWIDVILPGYSLVLIVIALNMIRIAHPYHVHYKIWVFRALLLGVMMIMPLFALAMNNAVIFGVVFGCIVLQLWVDVEGKEKIKHEKEEMKEKREMAKLESLEHSAQPVTDRFKHMRRVTSGIGKM